MRVLHDPELPGDHAAGAIVKLGCMTDASTFARRTAALLAADSEHLPRVLDVTALGDRRRLELAPVEGPTLEELLAARRRLEAGEAATVLIGTVRAVAALHRAGFCGAEIGPETLRLDHSGRPVLMCAGELRELIQAGSTAAGDDWRAVSALADRLGLLTYGRTSGPLGAAQSGLGLALATLAAAESEQNLDRLEDTLFELGPPAPVRLGGVAEAIPESTRSPLATRPRRSAAHRRPSASALVEAFDAGPKALLAGPLATVRARLAPLLSRGRAGSGRLLLGGGVAAALTVTAVILLSPGAPTERATDQRTVPVAAGRTASSAATASTSRATGPAADAPELGGDDPVAAAPVLLARRDGCLAFAGARRTACLGTVADLSADLSGDAGADAGAAALGEPDRPLAGLAPSLLERTGDSALIALAPQDPRTAPASALLMRTEAGWRLRQLYEN